VRERGRAAQAQVRQQLLDPALAQLVALPEWPTWRGHMLSAYAFPVQQAQVGCCASAAACCCLLPLLLPAPPRLCGRGWGAAKVAHRRCGSSG
jgi:hypothetical protein